MNATDSGAAGAVEARYCGNCGARRTDSSITYCSKCGQPFGEVLARPGPLAASWLPKAGFWVRTAAFAVDLLVLLVAAVIIELPIADAPAEVLGLVDSLLLVAYFTCFWSAWGGGRTPGMRAVGLKVVRVDGAPLSIPVAFLRNVGLSLSIAVVFVGVVAVAFDREKQGWHDKMVGTYVIRM